MCSGFSATSVVSALVSAERTIQSVLHPASSLDGHECPSYERCLYIRSISFAKSAADLSRRCRLLAAAAEASMRGVTLSRGRFTSLNGPAVNHGQVAGVVVVEQITAGKCDDHHGNLLIAIKKVAFYSSTLSGCGDYLLFIASVV